jgi:hypothetical protein
MVVYINDCFVTPKRYVNNAVSVVSRIHIH